MAEIPPELIKRIMLTMFAGQRRNWPGIYGSRDGLTPIEPPAFLLDYLRRHSKELTSTYPRAVVLRQLTGLNRAQPLKYAIPMIAKGASASRRAKYITKLLAALARLLARAKGRG